MICFNSLPASLIHLCLISNLQAIWLLTTGAREAAFRNIKTIAECLADELVNAAKGSSNRSEWAWEVKPVGQSLSQRVDKLYCRLVIALCLSSFGLYTSVLVFILLFLTDFISSTLPLQLCHQEEG